VSAHRVILPSAGAIKIQNTLGASEVSVHIVVLRAACDFGHGRSLLRAIVEGIGKLSPKTWKTVQFAYKTTNVALWGLLVAWAVVVLFSIPRLSDARAVVERERIQAIAAENRFFCEKWGLRTNTHEHVICTMDLNDIRARTEERLIEDGGF